MTQDGATVAAGDIARLAGVGRAAVSNWRRRFHDFPEPVGGTSSSPLFSLTEVETWLRGQGKLQELPADEHTWQQIRNAADDLRLASLVSSVAAFLVYIERHPQGWRSLSKKADAGIVAGLPDEVGVLAESHVPLLRAAAELAADRGHADVIEFLYRRYVDAHSRRVQVLSSDVASLMAALLDESCRTVLDPCCGFGPLLLAALPAATRLLGQERDESALRLASARLRIRGADAEVAAGDALTRDAFPELQADGVLCAPPFNERGWGYEKLANDPRWQFGLPPRGESELAWVQHCLAHLRPGGEAIVLMPPAAAGRRSGRRIRSRLLRAGALHGVISLRAGAAPQSAMPPHVWLLRRPGPDDGIPSEVLMADSAEEPSGKAVLEAWQAFRRGETLDTCSIRTVPIIELLDDEVDLTPGKYLPKTAADQPATLDRTLTDLLEFTAELTKAVPKVALDRRSLTMTTVAELSRTGTLQLVQTPMRMDTDSGDLPLLTAKDVTLGRSATGRGTGGPGLVVARPGDVVIPMIAGELIARVVTEEVALGPHLFLIRLNKESFDPHFVVGFLRVTPARAASTLSGAYRVDVRRARIPLLPLAEQRTYGDTFRQLERFEAILRQTNETGETLGRLVLAGLTEGDLRPDL
ncbi:N-6 DNA methylase [Sphaerisporangium sp. NPDC088356]|uniref:N-6 DNA methylase n=1 Tax=Sphaerisporangium sp. NPDC088356 TaxID=3154871 RepID=UPI003432380A